MELGKLSENLRSIKTEKALFSAVFLLLKKMNFRKITVKEICENALISRAAFYAHFTDKYDLLSGWLGSLWADNFWKNSYEYVEQVCNRHLHDATRVIKNILKGADVEIQQLLSRSVISTKPPALEDGGSISQSKQVVLSSFYAGGVISYLMWQVHNDFPKSVPLLNREIFQMLNGL